METISSDRLAAIFVEVADTLVDEFDLLDFLHMLTDRATSLVDAAAAGLLLTNARDRLDFMAASDENARLMELFQLQSQQGPCLEAYHTGKPVINVDLEAATHRWPIFAPQATAFGFRSVHAFPLRLRNQVIGALNIFGVTKGGDFQGTDVRIMQALADVATIGLLQERLVRRGENLTEQLQAALNSRVVIEQAKGVLTGRYDITVDAAFIAIRAYARGHHRSISDVARRIVTDPASLPDFPTL